MDHPQELTGLSLCTGYGGLDLGLEGAIGPVRWLAHVEIESFACANMVAKMEQGLMAPAPIWTDARTFPDPEALSVFMVDGDASLCDGYEQPPKEGIMPMPRHPIYDHAVELYGAGMSIQDVADYYAVSRQSMHKILQRRGCEFRPQYRNGSENHFARHGLRMNKRCQHLVEKAIQKGILVREACEVCGGNPTGSDGRSLVHAHHDNYNKPLDVRWLCQKHHHEWHKTNKAVARKEVPQEAECRVDVVTGGFP